jgi:nickel-dependent lactate racemase
LPTFVTFKWVVTETDNPRAEAKVLVEVWLPYGKTEVCVRVPTKNLLNIVEPKEKAAAQNPQDEIGAALANPLGTQRLLDIAEPGMKVAVVLKNSDTSTNQMIVSAVLKELNSAGVSDDNVAVIVAYDPFRTYAASQQMPVLGEMLSSQVSVALHNPSEGEYVEAGKTSRGTNIRLNKAFTEADVKVAAGVVEPHPFAGYSGGSEMVLPGVSSLEATHQNLLLALGRKAERGVLDGNPVHEDMAEAARLAGVDFSLNVVRNGGFEVVKGFAGSVDAAFSEAAKFADEVCRTPIDGRADIVFVSPGGFPFDGSLFEACSCLDVGVEAAKRGKPVVVVAECVNGYGDKEFIDAVSRFDAPKALEKHLKRHFSVGGLMAHRLMDFAQTSVLYLVSVVPHYYVSEAYRLKAARTANEAYRLASDAAGKNGKVTFVPYGNMVVPYVKAE